MRASTESPGSRAAHVQHRERAEPDSARAFSLFETPVFVFPLGGRDTLNAELRERFLVYSESTTGIEVSNRGGWHSPPDLAQRSEPCFRELVALVLEHVRVAFDEVACAAGVSARLPLHYSVHGWAMVMRSGHYTITHDHADAHWSAVYYVDAGDCPPEAHPESGALSFLSPVRGAGGIGGVDVFPTTFSVRPHSGTLVIFPGWLQHYVHPYQGQRPRISVSFNVRMDLAPPPGR